MLLVPVCLCLIYIGHDAGGLLTRHVGTEAVEASLKMARQYFIELGQPSRTKFIARKQSYHGNTLGSLGTGFHEARRAIYEPLLASNVSHVSPCYSYRGRKEGESAEDYVKRLAQELEDEFQAQGPGNVCAFIAETVSGTVSITFRLQVTNFYTISDKYVDSWLCPTGPRILQGNARSL